MKLVTRYSVLGILMLAVAILLGGYSIVENDYSNRISDQKQQLDLLAKKVEVSADPLSAVLLAADDYGSKLTVVFQTSDGTLTTMVDSAVQLTAAPTHSVAVRALKSPVLIHTNPPYLLRVVQLKDTDFVLLAADVDTIVDDHSRNLMNLLVMALIAVAVGGLIITLIVRLNMRSVVKTLTASADQERDTRQAMQTFMGDASHELRTPLTVIKGYAELLAGGQQPDETSRKKAYQRIVEQVDRMDETIGSLLQLAEVGSVSANSFEPQDLSALLEQATDDLAAMDHGREITRRIAKAVSVSGSADLLDRLLNNAIGNIHRHTPKDAEVRVTLAKQGKQAVLTIEDGGPGLPADAYSKGIQGFQRFDASRSRASGGTGLGMAIMNSIVEAHSGKLALEPSELGGLKLRITLPLN